MKYLKLFESETIQSKLNEQIGDYFINFFEDDTLEFVDRNKNRLILGYYFEGMDHIESYEKDLKEWTKLFNRFMIQLNEFKREYGIEIIEFKSKEPFGIEFSLVKKSEDILFKCDYYYVDGNNNVFFNKDRIKSLCAVCGLNAVKIKLDEWNTGYVLEIQSLNSYSRRESESITKVKELFFKLEKYKEFDYILSITDSPNQATRVYNKPVGLNINLRDIKGEYFLEGYK